MGGKESLLYLDASTQGGRAVSCPKPAAPSDQQGQEFLSVEGGLHAETAESPDSLLESGHRWSDQHHLVLNTVHLYFQSWFVSISWR